MTGPSPFSSFVSKITYYVLYTKNTHLHALKIIRIAEFYTELHASNSPSESHQQPPLPEIPDVTQSEIRHALNRMPNGKASGPDGISVETLKAGGACLDQQLASLYIYQVDLLGRK